jgi:CubicO group peptidase (beta-lactamase class C family)
MTMPHGKRTILDRNKNIVLGYILISCTFCTQIVFANQDIEPRSNNIQFKSFLENASNMSRLYGVIVSRNGEIILEDYFQESHRDKLVNIKSASKSVISALVGIAIQHGYISGINAPIKDYFGDLSEDIFDEEKNNITISDLLSMQSGLRPTSNRNYGVWVLSNDWVKFALTQSMEASPGTIMRYSTGNTHLLSAILTRATGKSTLEFAREYLSDSLGFSLAPWPTDPQGIYFGGNDMEMTARQMLQFGELYLNGGQIKGEQIISEEWVQLSLKRHAISTRERGRYYGYGWWLKNMAGYEVKYAWGYGGQYIILVPELNLVVVTTSSSTPHQDRRSHRRALTNSIENDIIQTVSDSLQ